MHCCRSCQCCGKPATTGHFCLSKQHQSRSSGKSPFFDRNSWLTVCQTCLNGAGTFGTNLQDCVAGVAKITAAGQDPSTVCGGALTVNLQVLCLTVGGDPCTAAGIAKVSTTQQAAVIAACPNQISPAVGKSLLLCSAVFL